MAPNGSKAYSFGISREAYNKTGTFSKGGGQTDRGVPGPGTYNAKDFVGKKGSKAYTLRTKSPLKGKFNHTQCFN